MTIEKYLRRGRRFAWWILLLPLLVGGCAATSATYDAAAFTAKSGLWVVNKGLTVGGKAAMGVVDASLWAWDAVSGPDPSQGKPSQLIPVETAIKSGKLKMSPYRIKGTLYEPMSVGEAKRYQEEGVASWYGHETWEKPGGNTTANGEPFTPYGLTAAHKFLPLPFKVQVTNLENGRSLVVRVNDRGPFPSPDNPHSGKRIIDLSMAAAKELGFYDKGTARVRVRAMVN